MIKDFAIRKGNCISYSGFPPSSRADSDSEPPLQVRSKSLTCLSAITRWFIILIRSHSH